jgi:hypothetical protein
MGKRVRVEPGSETICVQPKNEVSGNEMSIFPAPIHPYPSPHPRPTSTSLSRPPRYKSALIAAI